MTSTLTFQSQYGHPNTDNAIWLQIRILGGASSFAVNAVLDTGAYISCVASTKFTGALPTTEDD